MPNKEAYGPINFAVKRQKSVFYPNSHEFIQVLENY
jgi:hypothetical protein